jgi:hypothetical protein
VGSGSLNSLSYFGPQMKYKYTKMMAIKIPRGNGVFVGNLSPNCVMLQVRHVMRDTEFAFNVVVFNTSSALDFTCLESF